jgi:hypothetical protein
VFGIEQSRSDEEKRLLGRKPMHIVVSPMGLFAFTTLLVAAFLASVLVLTYATWWMTLLNNRTLLQTSYWAFYPARRREFKGNGTLLLVAFTGIAIPVMNI